jgi:CelD/BcsL family acetyltransferase involved in cellulose biosynthesis
MASRRCGCADTGRWSSRRCGRRSPTSAGEWDAFATRIGKKRRAELRRTERRLREQGDLHIEVYTGGPDLDARLAEGYRVEAAGWKGEQGTAIASTQTMGGFYTAVAHWAARQGWLHLVFLRLDGRAIAFEFILAHDRVMYDLKGGYDEQYRAWGPGIWLMHQILQRAFADDTRCIEWLGTDDPYKLEWSDGDAPPRPVRLRVEARRPAAGRPDSMAAPWDV